MSKNDKTQFVFVILWLIGILVITIISTNEVSWEIFIKKQAEQENLPIVQENKADDFTFTEIKRITLNYGRYAIYRHEQTGVYYLVNDDMIITMVNADGTPYIGTGENK